MKKVLSLLLLLMIVASCTNDLDTMEGVSFNELEKDIVLLNGNSLTKSSDDQRINILKFKNQSVFDETITHLKKMTNEERLEWEQEMNFVSLNSIYENALEEVTAMEGTAEENKTIKEKYQACLYFHEYKDDNGT